VLRWRVATLLLSSHRYFPPCGLRYLHLREGFYFSRYVLLHYMYYTTFFPSVICDCTCVRACISAGICCVNTHYFSEGLVYVSGHDLHQTCCICTHIISIQRGFVIIYASVFLCSIITGADGRRAHVSAYLGRMHLRQYQYPFLPLLCYLSMYYRFLRTRWRSS
jgi:hypothetical protein